MAADGGPVREERTPFHARDVPPPQAWQRVELTNQADLERRELEILERIRSTPNGGLLFLTNPLRALHDLGFDLSGDLKIQLQQREPSLLSSSDTAYHAIKLHGAQYVIQVSLDKLFRSRTP
jgi:hypothetical protein